MAERRKCQIVKYVGNWFFKLIAMTNSTAQFFSYVTWLMFKRFFSITFQLLHYRILCYLWYLFHPFYSYTISHSFICCVHLSFAIGKARMYLQLFLNLCWMFPIFISVNLRYYLNRAQEIPWLNIYDFITRKLIMGFEIKRFQGGDVDEELICPICSGVLEDPLQVWISWIDFVARFDVYILFQWY